tara:strand:- start:130 stop:1722 length:1593 start_codon:yes stop_codon:yes gene_type:complete
MDGLLMAQQLQTVSIKAAGFSGLNTEDSPVTIDPSFAEVAENAIIDKYGRIAARNGIVPVSTTGYAVFNKQPVKSLFEFVDYDGIKTVVSTGNNKIVTGTSTLVDKTPVGTTITDDNWKIASLANKCFMFQRNHEPLVMTIGSGGAITVEEIKGSQHSNGTPPQANEVIAAYGKLWAADVAGNKRTVYWSDTLIGGHWSGGASGSLDLTNVFPNGYDEIVALSAHNGFLVIFCRDCILIYSGAESPASMVLSDVIKGIGCIERDSVQNTGTDVLFLSNEGVRGLGRTIQEKSSPIGNISKNVRTDLIKAVRNHRGSLKSVYSPQDAFYLLSFPEDNIVYCFDLKGLLPDGSARVTTWSTVVPQSMTVLSDDSLYFGFQINPYHSGIFKYTGYKDATDPAGSMPEHFIFKYESTAMDFGRSANLKFLKKFEATVVGNAGEQSALVWYWDYNKNITKNFIYLPFEGEVTEGKYGISEYNTTAEYTTGIYVQTPSVNATGSGKVLQIGLNAFVSGKPYSIQSIDISVLLGRTK